MSGCVLLSDGVVDPVAGSVDRPSSAALVVGKVSLTLSAAAAVVIVESVSERVSVLSLSESDVVSMSSTDGISVVLIGLIV